MPIRSIPPHFYTSDAIAHQESKTLFRSNWLCVGRSDLVVNEGQFVTLDIAGHSVVLTRGKANRLAALANTCRHRGMRLAEGSGHCKGLRCPFHSWFYDLSGHLIAAPEMDAVDGFDKSAFDLHRYAIEERHGFIFLNLSPEPDDLDAQLADFAPLHSDWPLGTLVTIRRRELEVDCNWKLFLDVFNEYYHLPFVHAASINSIYERPETGDAVAGDFATQFGPTEGTGGLLDTQQSYALPDMEGLKGKATQGVRYTWLFPNMSFAANRDALWAYEAYPLSGAKCKVIQTCCFPQSSLKLPDFEEKSQAYLERMDAALQEDIDQLAVQQTGMSHPDAQSGPIHPLLETNVATFAKWYQSQMLEAEGNI
ncbi:MAG: aromatic ring-hydroxylating oxygenase subunit alpha [Paracoccaceae bacterium]